jgi:hypothetical protein
MITRIQRNTAEPIRLNSTFASIANGIVSLGEVVAQNRVAHRQMLTVEDDYARRRRLSREGIDPYTVNYCR